MSRPSRSAQKVANLRKPLVRDLAAYALAAGAAGVSAGALTEQASAQVVYTPAHQLIHSKQQLAIDLNHDGVTDMTIREIPCSLGTYFPANSLQAVPAQAGGVLIFSGAQALPAGARIGDGNFFYPSPIFMLNQTDYGVYYAGSWAFAPPSYLGIQFPIEGQTHYGWARLNVQFNSYARDIDVLLTGYAYEAQPNKPVRAGYLRGDDGADGMLAAENALQPRRAERDSRTLGALARGAQLLPRCTY